MQSIVEGLTPAELAFIETLKEVSVLCALCQAFEALASVCILSPGP